MSSPKRLAEQTPHDTAAHHPAPVPLIVEHCNDEIRQLELLLRRSLRCSMSWRAFSSSAARARRQVLEMLTDRFALHHYRDQWLAGAAFLMDRAAAAAADKETTNAVEVFSSKTLWLSAVLVVVKTSGADTELDCHPKDLLRPLMRGWPEDLDLGVEDCEDQQDQKARLQMCWEKLLLGEQRLCLLLDFDLLVPAPLELLQVLSRVILAAAEGSAWRGLHEGRVYAVRSSPRTKERPKAFPMKRFEALGAQLLEIGLMHSEEILSGSQAHLLVFASAHVALQSFGEEERSTQEVPVPCLEALALAQKRLLTDAEVSQLARLVKALCKVWEERDSCHSCIVAGKWTNRSAELGGKLPQPTAHAAAAAIAVTEAARQTKEVQRTSGWEPSISNTPPRRPSAGLATPYTGTPPRRATIKTTASEIRHSVTSGSGHTSLLQGSENQDQLKAQPEGKLEISSRTQRSMFPSLLKRLKPKLSLPASVPAQQMLAEASGVYRRKLQNTCQGSGMASQVQRQKLKRQWQPGGADQQLQEALLSIQPTPCFLIQGPSPPKRACSSRESGCT